MRWFAVAWVLCACGSSAADTDAGPPDATHVQHSCPGERPDLRDCFRGEFHANCGGNGEAVFACMDGWSCMWFEHGCVGLPRTAGFPFYSDFNVSSCPPDDLCCHRNSPFAGGTTFYGIDLVAYGIQPWTREREMRIPVRIDRGLVVADTALSCPGFERQLGEFMCGDDTAWWVPNDLLLIGFGYPGAGGAFLKIEIERTTVPAVARAYVYEYTDAPPVGCPTRKYRVPFATGGEIVLRELPTGDRPGREPIRGRVDLAFPGGGRINGTFKAGCQPWVNCP